MLTAADHERGAVQRVFLSAEMDRNQRRDMLSRDDLGRGRGAEVERERHRGAPFYATPGLSPARCQ